MMHHSAMASIVKTVKVTRNGTTISIVPRANCRRIIMRRTASGVSFSVPYGCDADAVMPIIQKMLEDHVDKLRPQSLYSRGQTIATSFGDIHFTDSPRFMGVECLRRADGYELAIHPSLDISSRPTILSIARALKKWGGYIVATHVINEAEAIAAGISVGPDRWTVGHGRRTFGTCRRRGRVTEISLSYTMAFLPPELRRYVVCHELAHLSEMNHSPRFHAICNAYCGGLEASLSRQLRATLLPFP